MRHSKIQLGENTVTKTSDPNLMRIEVEKNLRAYKISKNCGLFRVPEVLDYDEINGVAVFERIHDIHPIRNIIIESKQYSNLVEQIGRSLAVIHSDLVLPNNMIFELPSEFKLPGTEVYIHGDFNGMNVCYIPSSSSIVILDWQMTATHGGKATYGSRYFDIIWFINYLLWTPTFNYLFHDPVTNVAKHFLQAYFEEIDLLYDAEILEKYCRVFFETKLPDRKKNISWRSRYLLTRSNALTEKFIKSLHSIK